MVNLIQSVPVKAPVIADLKRLGLGDVPSYQRIAEVFVCLTAVVLVRGDANELKYLMVLFEP